MTPSGKGGIPGRGERSQGNYSSPNAVDRGKSSSLVAGLIPRSDKEGTLSLSSPLYPPRSGVARLSKKSGALYSLREIMHANIVKIRLRVRSRPKIVLKSERVRKQERERGGQEGDGRRGEREVSGMALRAAKVHWPKEKRNTV